MVGLLTELGLGSAPLLKSNRSLFCVTVFIGFSGAGTSVLQNAAFPRRCHPQSTRGSTVFWAPFLKDALCEACVSISSHFWS